jgi:hypothetical protein
MLQQPPTENAVAVPVADVARKQQEPQRIRLHSHHREEAEQTHSSQAIEVQTVSSVGPEAGMCTVAARPAAARRAATRTVMVHMFQPAQLQVYLFQQAAGQKLAYARSLPDLQSHDGLNQAECFFGVIYGPVYESTRHITGPDIGMHITPATGLQCRATAQYTGCTQTHARTMPRGRLAVVQLHTNTCSSTSSSNAHISQIASQPEMQLTPTRLPS